MSLVNTKQRIHVLKGKTNVCSFIRGMANISDEEKGFIVCDIGEIVRRYKEWTSALSRVKPYYAVKCNDHEIVLKTLSALGAGFDCSSKLEINKVLDTGVTTDRIIFAHPKKLISYINHARTVGVSMMTFDNEEELYKIKEHYPDSKLVLRFRCDDETAIAVLGIKFGCNYKTEAPKLLKLARELDLTVIGVCFHVGSGSNNPKIFHTAICYARELFDLARSFGYYFNFLDIGGGYLAVRSASIDMFAKIINHALNEYFPHPDVQIISEPGSFFVATSATLATNIHSLRTVKLRDNSGNMYLHNMYYLNDGYYGSFNMLVTHKCPFYVEPLYRRGNTELIDSSLWGPTCDSRDKVWEMKLPQMKAKDWLIFNDMGDYSFKSSSEFNGFPKPDIYFVVKEPIWMLLKDISPFTTDDFSTEDISNIKNYLKSKF